MIKKQLCNATTIHCKKTLLQCTFLFAFLCSNITGNAQQVSTVLSNNKILLGEQTVLELKIIFPSTAKLVDFKWFAIPDTFNLLEVVNRSTLDSLRTSSQLIYTQKITLTSFVAGTHQLPTFRAIWRNGNVSSVAFTVEVQEVNIDALVNYHDIKKIEPITATTDWQFIVIIGVAVLILTLSFVFFFDKIFPAKKQSYQVPPMFLLADALAQISSLKSVYIAGDYTVFFTQLTNVCRRFLDTNLDIDTAAKTTMEFIPCLKNIIPEHEIVAQFFQLMRLADIVKFAQFVPTDNHCIDAIHVAENFVQTIDAYTQQKNQNS